MYGDTGILLPAGQAHHQRPLYKSSHCCILFSYCRHLCQCCHLKLMSWQDSSNTLTLSSSTHCIEQWHKLTSFNWSLVPMQRTKLRTCWISGCSESHIRPMLTTDGVFNTNLTISAWRPHFRCSNINRNRAIHTCPVSMNCSLYSVTVTSKNVQYLSQNIKMSQHHAYDKMYCHRQRNTHELSQCLLLCEMKQQNFGQIWNFNSCYQWQRKSLPPKCIRYSKLSKLVCYIWCTSEAVISQVKQITVTYQCNAATKTQSRKIQTTKQKLNIMEWWLNYKRTKS